MNKLNSLIENPDHDMEDELRDPLEGRSGIPLLIIALVFIAAILLGLHLLITHIRQKNETKQPPQKESTLTIR